MDISKKLFDYSMQQIDAAGIPEGRWVLGGGTMLKEVYRHRESKDIDIFLDDPQFLGSLSPKLNDAVEANILDYQERTNFIKLHFPEGDVDFIVAGNITGYPPTRREVYGRHVLVDDPLEIVGKKIFFRSADFRPRDIFDLAVVYSDRGEDMIMLAAIMPEKIEELANRLAKMKNRSEYRDYVQSGELRPLEGAREITGNEMKLCLDFISRARHRLDRNEVIPAESIRSLRGFVKGIDTNVEREEDRV